MSIELTIRGRGSDRTLVALVDTGAQSNFLSQKVVKEEGLNAVPSTQGIIGVDGRPLSVYGKHVLKVTAQDSAGVTRSSDWEFLATDIKKHDAILGWL